MKVKVLTILVLCFGVAGLASAQNVIPVNPGTNTISAAIATASSGDILELAEGVYWETSTLNTLAGDLTIRGAEGAEVIIYGPTAPDSASDLMHIYGNLWLENLIFVGADSCTNGIMNYYGGVDNPGDELTADKNNLYISNCQFHVIGLGSDDHGSVIWGSKKSADYADGKFHPLDTLRVTDCFFYGGHLRDSLDWKAKYWEKYQRYLPGWEATTYKGINMQARQARYIEIRRSTLWSFQSDGIYIDGAFVGSSKNPEAGSDLQYVATIADHLTIFKMQRGDGIQYEWSNRNQSMSNSIVYVTGRFSFKAKRGEPDKTVAYYCMGDSSNNEDDFTPKTTFYSQMTVGPGCWPLTNPYFIAPDNGDFSLDPNLSDAIDGADPNSPDGPNMGDPHYNSPETAWPNKDECAAILAKAKAGPTTVDDHRPAVVEGFVLYQNHPNPFNPTTTISYSLARPGHVTLDIYSITGQKVRTLVQEVKEAGSYSVIWDGLGDQGQLVSSGIYFYRLQSGSAVEIRKMLLIK